jgi:hypothetical protein
MDCARAHNDGHFELVCVLDDVVAAVALSFLLLDFFERGIAASSSNAQITHIVIIC